jgi:hypothetical protein
MDRKRAELVDHIRKAMAAARAVNNEMCEYMLDLALTEALAQERRSIETASKRWFGGTQKKH